MNGSLQAKTQSRQRKTFATGSGSTSCEIPFPHVPLWAPAVCPCCLMGPTNPTATCSSSASSHILAFSMTYKGTFRIQDSCGSRPGRTAWRKRAETWPRGSARQNLLSLHFHCLRRSRRPAGPAACLDTVLPRVAAGCFRKPRHSFGASLPAFRRAPCRPAPEAPRTRDSPLSSQLPCAVEEGRMEATRLPPESLQPPLWPPRSPSFGQIGAFLICDHVGALQGICHRRTAYEMGTGHLV